jgi:hypothetical protein
MIKSDPETREDWRNSSRADQLIENYGTVTNFMGCTLMDDLLSPRFDIKAKDGNKLILKRIDPMIASAASLTGDRKDANPDYIYAEFGSFFIKLKDVFQIEIPPSGPDAPGGGVHFGPTLGLNGSWTWFNIQSEDNPYKEKGYWAMRAEAFSKPLENAEEAIMCIYRRFTHTMARDTEIGGDEAAVEQTLAADVTAEDVDSTNNTIALKLAGYITAEAGQAITLVADNAATRSGVVMSSDEASNYILALDSTPIFSDYTVSGGAKVTV